MKMVTWAYLMWQLVLLKKFMARFKSVLSERTTEHSFGVRNSEVNNKVAAKQMSNCIWCTRRYRNLLVSSRGTQSTHQQRKIKILTWF